MILHLFIEGEWDRKFFETFLHDYLLDTFNLEDIRYDEFSEDPLGTAREKLRKLAEQQRVFFLLCPDLDGQYDDSKRIQKIRKLATDEFKVEYEKIKDKAFVIVQEIESWYLAGFKESFCTKKKIKFYIDTSVTNKTTFGDIARTLKKDKTQLRDDLIRNKSNFSIDEAKVRNASFKKFLEKVASQVQKLS